MRPFNAVSQNHTELSALVARAKQLTQVQAIWQSIAPAPLKAYTQAGTVQHKRLTIYAENGAIAAKIKLLLPSLLIQLQKQGLEVTSIRVQVQVQSIRQSTQKPLRSLTPQAAQQLSEFAEQLADSPLAQSIRRLAKRR